jgi:molecular chaperone DnaK
VRSHTTLNLSFGGHVEKITITRQQFEGMADDLLERASDICEAVLKRAGLAWSKLGSVLPVGGATRMPMIRHLLVQKSGRLPDDHVCPDEAVARGAAIYAARLLQGHAEPPTLQVTSVSTHSLGIEGSDQKSGERVNKVLIPKGTALPAVATREFISKSNGQHTIAFNVLEGEDRHPAQCVKIGRVVLHDLPADLSDEWPVEIKYEYSCGGRLSVDARVRYTDRQVHLETLRPGGVSATHIERWKSVITAQAGMADYRRVRDWERATDAPPPVALGKDTFKSQQDLAEPTEHRLRSFLKRVMPFVFRHPASAAKSAAPPNNSHQTTPS